MKTFADLKRGDTVYFYRNTGSYFSPVFSYVLEEDPIIDVDVMMVNFKVPEAASVIIYNDIDISVLAENTVDVPFVNNDLVFGTDEEKLESYKTESINSRIEFHKEEIESLKKYLKYG